MEITKLGKTSLKISRIGFGCLAIAGFHYGKTDDKESIKAIKKAVKLGINFFDTADIYGFGKSEKLLASGLGENKDKVVVATKVGARWDEKKGRKYLDLTPEYISGAVEKSLENLQINTIPLYQIHYPYLKNKPEETMSALNMLKKDGKIKYVGCSNFTLRDLEKYRKYGRIDAIQVPYNLIDQKSEKMITFAAKKYGMGVIAYSPLAQGLLSGKFKSKKFSKNDRRSKSQYFKTESIKKAEPLFRGMEEIGKKYNKTMTQVALRWILDNPYVSCMIVGAKTEKEIAEAAGASGWKLSAKERNYLAKLGRKVLK
ncbi:MAG: aldo/keto reductase [Candidatus Nealsonbacteria bacterium]|nr:aldo/keto reductase [Candidatus Nealsonbacteria bacterium]